MSRIEALITPSVMKWARKQAKMSLEDASYKIKRSMEEIAEWENGISRPSIAQARKASAAYKRPLAVFYLPSPPKEFETLRDFRNLPNHHSRELSAELTLLIRTIKFRQEWLSEFLIMEGEEPLKFIGSANLEDKPRNIALDILNELQISPNDQKKCSSKQAALLFWLKRAEKAGIYVFRQRNIAVVEARGFLISDEIAPFIFINSDDSYAGQLFTLAHELAHLWLNFSGISNLERDGKPSEQNSARIEVFCNKIASEAILEKNIFTQEWERVSRITAIDERIEKISKTLNVSEEVVARRLLENGVIPRDLYLDLRNTYQLRWKKFKEIDIIKKKEKPSTPSYYRVRAAKIGYAFTQTVIGAFYGGEVSGRDASSLLDVKVSNLRRLGELTGIFVETRAK